MTERLNFNISGNATRLQELHARIKETFRLKPHGAAHKAACQAFSEKYDALAFPGGLTVGLERLQKSDPWAIEQAIRFLEADPWFFRSGYIKQTLVRHLKHLSFSPDQCTRLAAVVLASTSPTVPRRMFQVCAKLAPVLNVAKLVKQVEALARSTNPETRRRAKHVLHVLKSKRG